MANLIKTTTLVAPEKQIMVADELTFSIGAIMTNTGVSANAEGKKIIKAGTPLYGDIEDRDTAFVVATDTAVKGVFTVQITTAFANDEKITIDGTDYTKAATEDVATKKFSGTTAAQQVTSLLKMVTTDDYDVGAVSGATDKIGFTQKVVDESDTDGPTVTKTSTTGAIGSVTKTVTPDDGASNANCIALHDVDVTAGSANGTIVLFGFVDVNKLDEDVVALLSKNTRSNLNKKITFIK